MKKVIYFLVLLGFMLFPLFGEVFAMEGGSKAISDRGTAGVADLDYKKIIDVARKYIEATSSFGSRYNVDYKLKLIDRKGKWASVHYIPIPFGEGDPPGLLLEQVNGRWVVRVCGTDWSDWEKKLPPGFKY